MTPRPSYRTVQTRYSIRCACAGGRGAKDPGEQAPCAQAFLSRGMRLVRLPQEDADRDKANTDSRPAHRHLSAFSGGIRPDRCREMGAVRFATTTTILVEGHRLSSGGRLGCRGAVAVRRIAKIRPARPPIQSGRRALARSPWRRSPIAGARRDIRSLGAGGSGTPIRTEIRRTPFHHRETSPAGTRCRRSQLRAPLVRPKTIATM